MMTRDVILRPEAERDIAGIADYTVKQWGRRQARKYVADLVAREEAIQVAIE